MKAETLCLITFLLLLLLCAPNSIGKTDKPCDEMTDVYARMSCTIKNVVVLEKELASTHDCHAIIPLKHYMERMSGRKIPTYCDTEGIQ